VLIDYPGFNLRLARALRKRSPRQKIIYYISPQVWAWNRGRIKKMARHLDLMLCIFPFEADLYNESGLHAVFVGHPMIERLEAERIDTERDPNLVGLFPGSRLREVRKILPVLIDTANLLKRHKPTLRFEVAAASAELAAEMDKMLEQPRKISGQDRQMIQIKIGETAAIMQRAFVGIVASGSATLEAAYFRLPFVLIYKVAWPTYLAARLVVTIKYLGMPNVLANKEVVPEFIQHEAKPSLIVKTVRQLMEKTEARAQMVAGFDEIVSQLAKGDASKRAAQVIIDEIGKSTSKE
ncbi:MAG: lipid-A-disaccharide synthase, partial [Verrucomicrobia bacterium]